MISQNNETSLNTEIALSSPGSAHPATCTKAFRNRSWPGIVVALLLLLAAAWWAMVDPDLANDPSLDPASARLGGEATGADASGGGSGAASTNLGTGVASVNPDDKPRGDAQTEANQQEMVASGNDAPETVRVIPRIGFTPLEEPPVAAPKVAVVPSPTGGQGRGGTGGRAGGSGTSFMGIETKAERICYILDFSGSMYSHDRPKSPKIMHMLLELKRSVTQLPDDHSFYVIFFDDDDLPMGPTSMVRATSGNRSQWFKWSDDAVFGPDAGGGTDPSGALEYALEKLKPDAIYLLTDGGFDTAKSMEAINRHNSDRHCQINTVGFHDRSNEAGMQQIAQDNRGEYKYIPPPQSQSPPGP